jgi:hypothetical protein
MRQALVLVWVLPVSSAIAEGKTAPGTYKEWNDIDEVEIAQTFRFADFGKVVVTPLDKSAITLPPEAENTYAPTKQILDGSDGFFLEGLQKGISEFRKGLPVEAGAEPASGGSGGTKVLVVRGKLLTLDPGSKAARYWGGFGAGAGRAKISAEIVDSATGTVLARFSHEKRSGTGMFGGSYEKVMSKSLREVGKDFSKGLKAF